MEQLILQDDALKTIEKTTELIKDKSVKDKKAYASEKLAGGEYKPFQLPLDPTVRLGAPIVRKVFDSAQKPMWVQFDSLYPAGPESHVMFKVRCWLMIDGCMDAWMHGCMDAWMHGWMGR